MAGLQPDTIGIRHPATVIRYVDAGNEVLAASVTRLEPIGETVESGDRHVSPLCETTLEASVFGPIVGGVTSCAIAERLDRFLIDGHQIAFVSDATPQTALLRNATNPIGRALPFE